MIQIKLGSVELVIPFSQLRIHFALAKLNYSLVCLSLVKENIREANLPLLFIYLEQGLFILSEMIAFLVPLFPAKKP